MKIRFHIKHPSGYLPLQGLRLATRNWPCLLWACAVSIPFGLFAVSPLRPAIGRWTANRGMAGAIGALLDRIPYGAHTSARRLAANLNAAAFKHFQFHIDWNMLRYRIPKDVLCAILLEVAALLFIGAGTLSIYLATEPPGFTTLVKNSAKYLWRFLRALLLSCLFAGPVLAALILLRHLLLLHVGRIHSAHTIGLYSEVSGAVLLLLALSVLLWLDLAQVYAVRNGMLGNNRVRRGLVVAFRLIVRQFLWIWPMFLISCAIALGLLAAFLLGRETLIHGNHLWPAYLAAQFGIFLLLATRFWQRGMEVALVIAVERSTSVAAVLSQAHAQTPQANPTLQELVQKLKKETWARTDVPSLKTLFPKPAPLKLHATDIPTPASGTSAAAVPATQQIQESLLAEHAKKTTLLEATAEEPAHQSASMPGPVSRPSATRGPDSSKP